MGQDTSCKRWNPFTHKGIGDNHKNCTQYWEHMPHIFKLYALHLEKNTCQILEIIDMYMSYRWVSFWWKVTWQCHTESETRPSEIKSSITKTMLRHKEITHNAHPATRILLYDNSHWSHSNWNEGRQYLSKISHCPSQCCAWRGTVRSRRYNIATMLTLKTPN